MPLRVLRLVNPKLDDINNSIIKALHLAENGSEEEFDESLEECIKVSKEAVEILSRIKLNKDEEI